MLGGKTEVNFASNTNFISGSFTNTTGATLPAGTYYVIINPNFNPGVSSSAIFFNIYYYISTAINGTGTIYFVLNDTNSKVTESFGNGSTYATLYQVGIFILTASTTVYGSVQINYTVSGPNNGNIPPSPGSTSFYRIA